MWIDDIILKECSKQIYSQVYFPKSNLVVLGSANKADSESHENVCKEMNIPIVKRYGGGGTVVLYPGCLVISLGTWVRHPYQNAEYFKLINQGVIDCLSEFRSGFKNLLQDGHSDIVWGDKKIAGTSIFRSRNYLLYQASIICDLDIELIESCLPHPTREPEYRGKKSHREFLTDLAAVNSEFSSDLLDVLSLSKHFVGTLDKVVRGRLDKELVNPDAKQIRYILSRMKRGEESDPILDLKQKWLKD